MADKDEFDSAIEDAIRPDDEPDASIVLGDDPDDDEPPARTPDGDDPDDAEPPIDRAREIEAKVVEAASIAQQWDAEHARRAEALKDAQEKFKAIRKKVMADEATDDDEIAAQDAVLEARYALDKARDSLGQARAWHQQVANQPRLAPAQQAWLDANPKYSTDPRFQKQAQQAMRELADSGMDPTHQNFYRKVDEKLRAPTRMGRDSRRTPGAPAIRTDKSRDDSSRMSEAEAKFVTKLGYDPRDKRVAEQWAKSKANTKRVAQKRGFL